MKSPRALLFAAALILLVASWGAGEGRRSSNTSGDFPGAAGPVSLGDCAFQRDPDSHLLGLRRAMEMLSSQTERVGRVLQGAGASRLASPGDPDRRSELPSRGYIDDFIFEKMRQDNVPHADLSSDAEFLRRVCLDLTGRIPDAEEVRLFLENTAPSKRDALIDRLIASPEFIDTWTMFFGDLLRNTSADSNVTRYIDGRNAFHKAIRNYLESGMPYDVFVYRLINSSGSTWDYGEGNWIMGGVTPMGPVQDTYDTLAVRASSQFLGISHLDCLLCHSGPGHLDKVNLWGAGIQRSQAWGMSAFFSRHRTTRSGAQGPNQNVYYWTLSDATAGDYNLNTTAGNRTPRQAIGSTTSIRPRYLFTNEQQSGSTYREMLANNIIRDRQFARATVNYLWQRMMGMGIVEPADQFDLARQEPWRKLPEGWTTQPSHPQLLESLADEFIGSNFDIRHILRQIASSTTYQLSSFFPGEWRIEYGPYFARKLVRRLTAEEVHDAIVKATNIYNSYTVEGFAEPVRWAMQLPETQGTGSAGEPRSNSTIATFLNFFLRGNRDQNMRSGEATIFQALNMMNNTFVTTRVRSTTAGGTIARLLADKSLYDELLIDNLFLAFLSRFPTRSELAASLAALKANRTTGAENLAWVLLNKVDFLYNY